MMQRQHKRRSFVLHCDDKWTKEIAQKVVISVVTGQHDRRSWGKLDFIAARRFYVETYQRGCVC